MTAALVQGILNRYLQKYLKNVTTGRCQILKMDSSRNRYKCEHYLILLVCAEHATLWGGELVFKNVELRLDVLQVCFPVRVYLICRSIFTTVVMSAESYETFQPSGRTWNPSSFYPGVHSGAQGNPLSTAKYICW